MKRIVVLGSGFAGTYTTRHLDRTFRHDNDVEITLISRTNYMVFTPLLAEVAGNVVEPRHAAPPLRVFLHKARFCQAEVMRVNVEEQWVEVQSSDQEFDKIPFDYLVLALGSASNFRNAVGSEANSYDLKSLEDAIRLRNHVLLMLEQADHTADPEKRRELLTFVAAGGGYAGIEGLGQLVDFVDKSLRYYPSIKREDVAYVLASRGKKLLEEIDERLGDYVVNKLRKRGVDVRLGVKVTAVTQHSAVLEPGGTIPTQTVLWAAGVRVSPVVEGIDVPKSSFGGVVVTSTLQVKDYPHIFALGDCAAVPKGADTFYAPTAQNATREAKFAANNLTALIRGGELKPFYFEPLGSLASIGHYEAVARVMGFSFSGFLAWFAWRTIYLAKLPAMSRKLRVMLDWTLEMVLHSDIVQLPVMPSDDMRFMQMRDAHTKMLEASEHPTKDAQQEHAQRISDAAPEAAPVTPVDAVKAQS